MRRVIKPYQLIFMLLILSVSIPLIFLLIVEPPPAMKNAIEFVNSATFSNDGNLLLVGGTKTAWLQDPYSADILHHWKGHKLGVVATAISGDNSTAVTGDKNSLFQIWDIPSGKRLHKIQLQNYEYGHAATPKKNSKPIAVLSHDGSMLLLRSGYGQVILFNRSTEEKTVITTEQSINEITAIAIHPNNRYLYTAYRNNTLTCWDSTDSSHSSTMSCSEPIQSLAISPEGNDIVVGTSQSYVYIADSKSLTSKDIILTNGSVDHIRFSPDGTFLTVNTQRDTQTVYSYPGLLYVQNIDRSDGLIMAMGVNWDQNTLFTLNIMGSTFAYDIWSGKPKWRQDHFVEPNPEDPNIKRINIEETKPQFEIPDPSAELVSHIETPIGQPINWNALPFSEAILFLENDLSLPLNTTEIKFPAPNPGYISINQALFSFFLCNRTPYVIHKNELIEVNPDITIEEINSMECSALKEYYFNFTRDFFYYDYHHFFKQIQEMHPIQYQIKKDCRKAITFQAENPTPKDILLAVLQDNGLMYTILADEINVHDQISHEYTSFLKSKLSQKKHTKNSILTELRSIQNIQPGANSNFTPHAFSAWIRNVHKNNQNFILKFKRVSVDDSSLSKTLTSNQKQLAFFNRVLQNWGIDLSEKEMTTEQAVQVLLSNPSDIPSAQMLYRSFYNQIRQNVNELKFSETTYTISSDISQRRLDQTITSFDPNTPNPQRTASSVLSNKQSDYSTFIQSEYFLQQFCFGSDWNLFFQHGYSVGFIDNENRKVYLTRPDDTVVYVFTLHPNNNAYWNNMKCYFNDALVRELNCEDFQTFEDFLIPQQVTEILYLKNPINHITRYELIFAKMDGSSGSISK